jgi:hypothetical protein
MGGICLVQSQTITDGASCFFNRSTASRRQARRPPLVDISNTEHRSFANRMSCNTPVPDPIATHLVSRRPSGLNGSAHVDGMSGAGPVACETTPVPHSATQLA